MSAPANISPKSPMKKSIWSDLPRRLATICIGFPLVCKMLSHPNLALIFFMGAHFLVTREYSLLEPKINDAKPVRQEPTTMSSFLVLGFSIVSMCLAHVQNDSLFHFTIACTAGCFVWLKRQHWILGLLFITLPFRTWYQISQDFASTLSVLLVVWNCDTGALLFGRLSASSGIPRMKVPNWILRVSPAKSMEGFLGGVVGGTWTAVSWIPAMTTWFEVRASSDFDALWGPLSNRIFLGVVMSFLAITGDLVESSIKRQSKSKDSGSVLPGHGGILDRFDSSLLAVLFYKFAIEYTTQL